ncbi:unnamed protein product [Paramecium sonneborni]|uniref:Uncharacterized protein n=1 Tax=Paramecium sonneborni TaxID=65129 RepID=A0A8S1RUU2_9CILI|nr:unnamed protein product [Paramecium sonneborni]
MLDNMATNFNLRNYYNLVIYNELRQIPNVKQFYINLLMSSYLSLQNIQQSQCIMSSSILALIYAQYSIHQQCLYTPNLITLNYLLRLSSIQFGDRYNSLITSTQQITQNHCLSSTILGIIYSIVITQNLRLLKHFQFI